MSDLRRPAVVLILTLGVLFSSPGVAVALGSDAAGHVYVSGQDCAFAHAHIDNNNGAPYVWTYASIDWAGQNGWCTNTVAQTPPNTLSVGQDLLYYDTSSGPGYEVWRYCNIGLWYYNQTTTHAMTTSWAPYHPCGRAKWYMLNGYARTWNNVWHGGYRQTQPVNSGYS